jgi:tripartite-type tricarboxylate transporter receptor subunit TctC
MHFLCRGLLGLAAAVTAWASLPAIPNSAHAQTYPSRPVRIIVGFPAGGSADIVARVIGQWLSERLGQQFVIENRAGASGNIAAEAVVIAPPDGYTLLFVVPGSATNVWLMPNLNFNFLRDLAPVAGLVRYPNLMEVNPALPVKNVAEFIAYAKANPGKLNFASAGNGTTQHISGELFKMMTGVDMQHVPYRGNAPALTDLIAGQVQLMFDNLPSSIEHVRSGRLRPLAVTTMVRSPALPDVPTVANAVPGFEASGWFGIAAPIKTPLDVVNKLNSEINAGLADAKVKERFADLGGLAFTGTAAEFRQHITDETEKWGKVIKAANIKAE